MATLAVVVTTYNRPDALEAVLAGYRGQRDLAFELLVADDGSTGETAALVERFRRRTPFPVRHVWHADAGFRAGAIRNRAIVATQADYVVFTDGDCVPLASFVERHRWFAERGWFVSGSHVLCSPDFTQRFLEGRDNLSRWSQRRWLAARVWGELNRLAPLLRLPHSLATSRRWADSWEKARTCNLAAWREDLLAVNGFDETYEGWGMEDSDLALRLIHHGVRHRHVPCGLGVVHLWHREQDRANLARNRDLLAELQRTWRTRAALGIAEAAQGERERRDVITEAA